MSYLGTEPSSITRKEILKIALHNPAVGICVEFWRQGRCTWEQAMMLAVKVLFELVDNLQQEAIDRASAMPPMTIKWIPPEEPSDG